MITDHMIDVRLPEYFAVVQIWDEQAQSWEETKEPDHTR